MKEQKTSGFFEIIASRKSGEKLMAAWVIAGRAAGAKALFAPEEEHCAEEYGEECRGVYREVFRDKVFPEGCAVKIQKLPRGREGILEYDDMRIFLEPIAAGRKLVICGAGHVALSVIRIGVMLGFEITVIEDREEFASRALEAGAHHVICRPFGEALDETEGDLSTAFVIMTREHTHDVDCIRRILEKPCVYMGMMGSRGRAAQIRQQMLAEGYDAQRVEQLHMPIGLQIGSRTPAEIAVSVMAELIRVMNEADTGEGYPEGMAEELAGLTEVTGAAGEPAGLTEVTGAAGEPAGLPEDPAAVLAMIVEKSGEAPRRPGTKMLVRRDGSILGTVGGGYAEARILESAGEMIRDAHPECRLVQISMKKGIMHCGGEITVFLLPL